MKKKLLSTLLLFTLFQFIPAESAEELKEYLIRGMKDYALSEQRKDFDRHTFNSQKPESDEVQETAYEGNLVYSNYNYTGTEENKPGNLYVLRYYKAALQKLGGQVLWETENELHSSFKRNNKQYYMRIRSHRGDRCEVWILEVAELITEVKVLNDDDVFSGMPNYKQAERNKSFQQLIIKSPQPENEDAKESAYEGYLVTLKYYFEGDNTYCPSSLQILRNYKSALAKLNGEILWDNDSNEFHASFKRNSKQYYMKLSSSNYGDRYDVYVLEQGGFDIDVEILDDVIDDNTKTNNEIKKTDDVIIDDNNTNTNNVTVKTDDANTADNGTMIKIPTSQWKANFFAKLGEFLNTDLSNGVFTVTERPGYDPAFRFQHSCDAGDFINVLCFDDGKDVFNSAVVTIKLDGVGENTGIVWLVIAAATIAGQPNATTDEVVELMHVICPDFNDVLTGKQRLNGTQAAKLYGVTYMLELNEKERYARFGCNVVITKE